MFNALKSLKSFTLNKIKINDFIFVFKEEFEEEFKEEFFKVFNESKLYSKFLFFKIYIDDDDKRRCYC